jgi:hypothetical protein
MMTNNTLRIRHEANLTSYGTHRNGNSKPIICIELQKTFNSLTDAAEFFGVTHGQIWSALNGFSQKLGLWERDENGKRIRRICYCHLEYANNIEAVADKLMTSGRIMRDDLNKANEEIEHLKNYNILLSEELEKKSVECNTQLSEKDNMRLMLKQLFEEKSALEKAKAEVARLEASVAEMEMNLERMV